MKTLIRMTAAVAIMLIALPAVADEVNWLKHPSFDEVLANAKSEDKHILIDFYTLWCGPCKTMEKSTYPDPKVAGFLNSMIPIKYNSEKGEGIQVSRKFSVNSWPTHILLAPDGEEVGRYIGLLDAEDFLQVMSDYKEGLGTIEHYEKKVLGDPNNATTWKTLGTMYAEAREGDKAIAALTRYLELADNPSHDEKAEVTYELAYIRYNAKAYDKAVDGFELFLENYSDTEYRGSATKLLARSYHYTDQNDKAVATYKAYTDENADDAGACNAFAWFCATKKIGLDESLPYALKAVELTDRSPGYLDTLAELYYAREEYDLAIQIGTEALEKEPSDQYFKDQIDKFKKAKTDADSRAAK